ncbi:MAG: hypothetical protein GY749_45400 [Desulfobacteraceae bacterium]|nr:hypothetical protein [Desulfobacteraceae bacterium]
MEIYPSEMLFYNFLDEVAGIVQPRMHKKNIEFIHHYDKNIPKVIRADEKLLRQVLLNLLGNAAKFTEIGSVTFRVKTLQLGHASCRIGFQVEDTGIGMTPEQMEKIFLPFEQTGDAKYRVEGTGLGLSISRNLVKLMRGEIQVKSWLNKGSLFQFEAEFPVSDSLTESIPADNKIITGYKGLGKNVLSQPSFRGKWENHGGFLHFNPESTGFRVEIKKSLSDFLIFPGMTHSENWDNAFFPSP